MRFLRNRHSFRCNSSKRKRQRYFNYHREFNGYRTNDYTSLSHRCSLRKLNTNEGEKLLSRSTTANDDKKVKAKIPWYIIGFFLFSIIATFNIIPEIVSHTAHTISSQFEIIALAGIGMRVKFRDLVKDGPKALLYGGTVGICQVAIGLIFIFFGLI